MQESMYLDRGEISPVKNERKIGCHFTNLWLNGDSVDIAMLSLRVQRNVLHINKQTEVM